MKFILPITILSAALLASNVEARWKPQPGLTWDYLLGANSDVFKKSDKDVVTIDLEGANGNSGHFHSNHQNVICYFSGGTVEKNREDYDSYKKAGVILEGTKSPWGNAYVDVRKVDKLRPLIRHRMERAKSFGCDAVEVDSLGVYGHNVSGITKDHCKKFAEMVADVGHDVGISVGLKNVPALAEELDSKFDFAVVETCAPWNECNKYYGFIKQNKAVFTVHYKGEYNNFKVDLNSESSRKHLGEILGGHGFTCAYAENNKLTQSNINYDCKHGNIIKGKSNIKTTTSTTVASSTTTSSTATAATTTNVTATNTPGQTGINGNINGNINGATNSTNTTVAQNANAAGKPGVPGNANAGQANQGNNNGPKEVNTVLPQDDQDHDNGNGVGAAVAVVAAGGVATAAVAGFVFLKKHNKFTSENIDEEENEINEEDETNEEEEESNEDENKIEVVLEE